MFINLNAYAKAYARRINSKIAISVALIATLVLLVIGIVVEYSHTSIHRTQLQYAADTAAVATAIKYRQNNLEDFGWAKMTGERVFRYTAKNLDSLESHQVNIEMDDEHIHVTSTAKIKPKFVQIFGYLNFNLSVSSETDIGPKNQLKTAANLNNER